MDELVSLIKQESASDDECTPSKTNKKKETVNASKKKRKASESAVPITEPTPIRKEPSLKKKTHKHINSAEQEDTKNDKVATRSQKKKTNGELFNTTQIIKEEMDELFTAPTTKRKLKRIVFT